MIIAQGGEFAGWCLYLHEGKPAFCHNLLALKRFKVYGDTPVPAGKHQVRMEFAYDGGGLAKGGDVTLYVDGTKVGEGRVDATVPMIYSADETCDLGSDTGTPVSDDYTSETSHFTGTINWVQTRRRRRRPRPPDHARGAPARRDGAAVRSRHHPRPRPFDPEVRTR